MAFRPFTRQRALFARTTPRHRRNAHFKPSLQTLPRPLQTSTSYRESPCFAGPITGLRITSAVFAVTAELSVSQHKSRFLPQTRSRQSDWLPSRPTLRILVGIFLTKERRACPLSATASPPQSSGKGSLSTLKPPEVIRPQFREGPLSFSSLPPMKHRTRSRKSRRADKSRPVRLTAFINSVR